MRAGRHAFLTVLAKALVLTMVSSSHIHFMGLWRTHVVASPFMLGAQQALLHTASCSAPASLNIGANHINGASKSD